MRLHNPPPPKDTFTAVRTSRLIGLLLLLLLHKSVRYEVVMVVKVTFWIVNKLWSYSWLQSFLKTEMSCSFETLEPPTRLQGVTIQKIAINTLL